MIRQLTFHEVEQYISDDTVRPHLSAEFRTRAGRQVWGLFEDQYAVAHEPHTAPLAVICVAYTTVAPTRELELVWFSSLTCAVTAVFYTVWSYAKGSGQIIVNTVAQHLQATRPEITRWVTLSPLTNMAENFHTKNGAVLHSVHNTCQIFDYTDLMRQIQPSVTHHRNFALAVHNSYFKDTPAQSEQARSVSAKFRNSRAAVNAFLNTSVQLKQILSLDTQGVQLLHSKPVQRFSSYTVLRPAHSASQAYNGESSVRTQCQLCKRTVLV